MRTTLALLLAWSLSLSATAQLTTTTGGVGSNAIPDLVMVQGYTKLVNNTGRTLMIERDNDDSWLTFHDPNDYWYSMGIDRSHSGNFTINSGGTLVPGHFVMTWGGNVGIGTATPLAKLEVSSPGTGGSTRIFGVMIGSGNGGHELNLMGGAPVDTPSWAAQLAGGQIRLGGNARGDGDKNAIQFIQNGQEHMRVNDGGNVGIGTAAPDAKLSVKGQVHAQEVKVDLNGAIAPDYVFNKDYKLPSLDEIKSFIKQNNHLPEVPSAKQMEENGINVGEMNLLLLKKVEELTLYIIEQQQQLQNQKAAMETITQELADIRNRK